MAAGRKAFPPFLSIICKCFSALNFPLHLAVKQAVSFNLQKFLFFLFQIDQLMRKCWIFKHDKRTTFHNLIQGFETIMSKM